MATEIPSRDLRNDVAGVLRRIADGETLTVLSHGRPVATLAPLDPRPSSMAWAEFWAAIERTGADRALLDDLRDSLPDTTDDIDLS